jgi:hypothetical protein
MAAKRISSAGQAPPPKCSLCGDQEGTLNPISSGFACLPCVELGRTGRDTATKAARALKISRTEKATAGLVRESGDDAVSHEAGALEYATKAAALFQAESIPELAHGEAVPANRSRLVDTLKAPNVVGLDASAHRLELLGRLGLDCTAMALDASDSIKAENSLEKMLAHQLAVAHKVSLEIVEKATFEQNTTERARMLNLAARMMEVFQRGMLTLQRLRTGGDQRILVQHVTVSDGGKAIVGNVKVGGGKK